MGLFDFLLGASLASDSGSSKKSNTDTLITTASLDTLERALEEFDYDIQRTKMCITAKHGGTWSTNGHISNIQIIDNGRYRECTNTETSQGSLCNPRTGRLAKIVALAESYEDDE